MLRLILLNTLLIKKHNANNILRTLARESEREKERGRERTRTTPFETSYKKILFNYAINQNSLEAII